MTAVAGGAEATALASEGVRPALTPKPRPTARQRWRKRLGLRANRALVAVVGFVVFWHVMALYVVDKPLFLTGPVDVARALRDQWQDGTLATDFWVSSVEFGKGFGLGLLVGVVLGTALGTSRRAKGYIDPLLNGFHSTPLIALAPLFILWFGIGQAKTVLLVFIVVVVPVAIDTDVGIRSTDPQLLEAARSFGASRWQQFTMVRLPTAVPFLVAGIRSGIARGLVGVVVGEFFGSQEGLGHRLLVASQFFDNAALLSGVLVFSVAGVVLTSVFERLERRVAPWKYEG